MFGLLTPYAPELRVREHEYYRALYCGTCREMRKTTGNRSALALSYDLVFFCAVRLLYAEEPPKTLLRRCFLHPFRKHRETLPTKESRLTARVSAVLTAAKLADDKKDERGMRRLLARILARLLRKAEKRAAMPALSARLAEILSRLSALEDKKAKTVDAPAALSGEMLGEVFATEAPDGEDRRTLYRFGDLLGRVIYKIDAYRDYEEDKTRDRYNPYRLLYGDTLSEEARRSIRTAILCECADLEEAMQALPLREGDALSEIVKNTVYLGLVRTLDTAKATTKGT